LRFAPHHFQRHFGLFLARKWEEFHSEPLDS
jgi:hypothetical protein